MADDREQIEIGSLESDETGLSFEAAISRIARGLAQANNPLITGLQNLSTESQRAVIKLAGQVRATVDGSSENLGRGNMFAFQKHGRVTATLGEIQLRSNLILYWFCDPGSVLPEVIEQLPSESCRRVVVHSISTGTDSSAAQVIRIPDGLAVESLWLLRAFVDGVNVEPCEKLPTSELAKLAEALKTSTYGTILWGNEQVDPEFDVQADGIHALIRGLNQHTRFVGLPLRADANGLGAENVSTWSLGFPFAVNLNRGVARQYWLEYSDETISERDEWDFLLMFSASEMVAVSQLGGGRSAFQIGLPFAELGIHDAGDTCRLDDVAIWQTASAACADQPTKLLPVIDVINAISVALDGDRVNR